MPDSLSPAPRRRRLAPVAASALASLLVAAAGILTPRPAPAGSSVPAAEAARGALLLPPPANVDAQPLLAQARRVEEALEGLGTPLPPESRDLLRRAAREADDARAVRLVQQALDPHCLGAVRLPRGREAAVTPAASPPTLVEQGWTTVLVKVLNDGGYTTPLRVHSPNAGPVHGAPARSVAARWLEVEPHYQRPLSAPLGGLPLEYRVFQVYSRDAGRRRVARIAFDAGGAALGAAGPSPVRVWDFSKGADGWEALNHSTLAVRGGSLVVRSTGVDPFLVAPVRMSGGAMRLRVKMRAGHDDTAQVFWATEDAPEFDGVRNVAFPFQKTDAPREYAADFVVKGPLTRLRLDLGGTPGAETAIEWAELVCVDGPDAWAAATFPLTTAPARRVTLRVRDEAGKPATAGFLIRDRRGRVYPAQGKRLAPDFFFQPQVYRADGETLLLPDGDYTVSCSRGPESVPETKALRVAGRATTLKYRPRRWVDPAARGWWSGDHHIHAAGCLHYSDPTQGVRPEDMARHIRGEDLKVGCNLTWGPCFDFQSRFFTGAPDAASRYPYLLRYDVEVSGFGSSPSGHLCLLGLKEQIPPGATGTEGWPTLGLNTLRWAKRQGAVCGTAHSGLGLTGAVARLPYPDGPGGLPSYAIPPYDNCGANEYVVDVTHRVPGPDGRPVPAVDFLATMNTDPRAELNIWYHTLNCGFRTRVSGETDFPCLSGDRVGKGRVYVKQDGRLTFDGWIAGLRTGRSYVSDGRYHLMDFRVSAPGAGTARVGEKESELRLARPGRVAARVAVAALDPVRKTVSVELIVNGYPVARKAVPADGRTREVALEADVAHSGWVAVRAFPYAHTNPVWTLVGGKPVRASRRSAEWCLRGVDQCWEQKRASYRPQEQADAEAAYAHARATYRRIRAESVAD